MPDTTTGLTRDTDGLLVEGATFSSSYSIMVLLSMVIFVAAFATGLGNISWQQGELFGLAVRDIGTSVCTAVNWYVLPCRSISLNVQDAHLWVRIRSCNP
jgi:hypothetical protein